MVTKEEIQAEIKKRKTQSNIAAYKELSKNHNIITQTRDKESTLTAKIGKTGMNKVLEKQSKLNKKSYQEPAKDIKPSEQQDTGLAPSTKKQLIIDTKEQPSNPTIPRNISPTSVSQQK